MSTYAPPPITDSVFGLGEQRGDGLVRWTATVPVGDVGELLARWDERMFGAWPNGAVTVRTVTNWHTAGRERVAVVGVSLPVHVARQLAAASSTVAPNA